MAITTYANYKTKVNSPYQLTYDTKNTLTTVAGRSFSLWATAPNNGAAPTTAAVPTNSTVGSLGQLNSSGVMRLAQAEISCAGAGGMIWVCDRLSHQGGLSAIITTAQTTNLPTAALTRNTSGVGVFAALEIYTQVGVTSTTVTASYTNSGGTSGHTTQATDIGNTGFREANRFIILPLQSGDVGVKSVESITIALTTGTAGNLGVTLFKPLFAMPVCGTGGQQIQFDSIIGMCGNMPQIVSNACLFYIYIANQSATGILQNTFHFIEE